MLNDEVVRPVTDSLKFTAKTMGEVFTLPPLGVMLGVGLVRSEMMVAEAGMF